MKIQRIERWRRVLIAAIFVVVQCYGSSDARVTNGDKIPDAQKNVKPTADKCRSSNVVSVGGASVATSEAIDLGCLSSVSDVRALLAHPDTLLIDLRPGIDFQAFHIVNALNLSPPDLYSKPYWRTKKVVLIGSGKAEHELYRECARLKQSGYKQVRVLHGGMSMWLAQNQPVVGPAPSAQQLARLSAAEFWLEGQSANNLVMLSKEQVALQRHFPQSQVVSLMADEAVKSLLDRWRKTKKNAPVTAVVVVAEPTITDEQIQRLQQSVMPVPLLVYTDTREAFERYVATQKASWLVQVRSQNSRVADCND